MDIEKAFQKFDSAGHHTEPTNEELGIEPLTGWPRLAVWAGLTACSLAVIVAIARGFLWLFS